MPIHWVVTPPSPPPPPPHTQTHTLSHTHHNVCTACHNRLKAHHASSLLLAPECVLPTRDRVLLRLSSPVATLSAHFKKYTTFLSSDDRDTGHKALMPGIRGETGSLDFSMPASPKKPTAGARGRVAAHPRPAQPSSFRTLGAAGVGRGQQADASMDAPLCAMQQQATSWKCNGSNGHVIRCATDDSESFK